MDASRSRATHWAPALFLLVSLACGIGAVFATTMNHNASYLLFIAGRVVNGARMYIDFPEINPPLIIWMNMPLAWVGQLTGFTASAVFRLSIIIFSLASIAASAALLRPLVGKLDVWAWLAFGIYTTLLLPGYSFGEREHIALLFTLPYLAEAARRMHGAACSARLQVAVALLAAIGLAIKPHFLLVPLLVEGAISLRLRRLPGAGAAAAALLLAVYGACVYWLSPEYLRMLHLVAGPYWLNSESWLSFLRVPQFYIAIVLVAIAWAVRPKARSLIGVVSLAALAFAFAAVIQHKGWAYHWFPALALCWLLFGLAVAAASAHRGAAVPFIVTSMVAVLSVWTLFDAMRSGESINPNPKLLAPAIKEMGGGPVIVFSSFEASFPLVTMPGIGTSTRFPTMTLLNAVELGGDKAALTWVRQSFVDDFHKQPPRLLLIETDAGGKPVFDFIGYFAPMVPELWTYRPVRRIGKFQILEAPDAKQRQFGHGL